MIVFTKIYQFVFGGIPIFCAVILLITNIYPFNFGGIFLALLIGGLGLLLWNNAPN